MIDFLDPVSQFDTFRRYSHNEKACTAVKVTQTHTYSAYKPYDRPSRYYWWTKKRSFYRLHRAYSVSGLFLPVELRCRSVGWSVCKNGSMNGVL